MKDRKEIVVDTNTRGKIVYAKANKSCYSNYLLLIDRVGPDTYDFKTPAMMIYTHISLILPKSNISVNENERWAWNNGDFSFYTPTAEEVELIKNILKERGLKFVKGINKVIKR